MKTPEATSSIPAKREFKLKPYRADGTCNFTGTIVNNTNTDLVLQFGRAGAPARILANGGTGSFTNDSPTEASGTVQYANDRASFSVHWNVPWIGPNDISCYADPGGVFYIQQSGDTGGYSPSVTWTLSLV